MSAVEEYQSEAHTSNFCPDAGFHIRDLADAAIAQLQATIEESMCEVVRLKAECEEQQAIIERLEARLKSVPALESQLAHDRRLLSQNPNQRAEQAERELAKKYDTFVPKELYDQMERERDEARAEAAMLERMLDAAWDDSNPYATTFDTKDDWLADLRGRAEKEAAS